MVTVNRISSFRRDRPVGRQISWEELGLGDMVPGSLSPVIVITRVRFFPSKYEATSAGRGNYAVINLVVGDKQENRWIQTQAEAVCGFLEERDKADFPIEARFTVKHGAGGAYYDLVDA